MATTTATELLQAVLEAIDQGDAERVLTVLESASEGPRHRIAPKLRAKQREIRGGRWLGPSPEPPSPQRVAAATACIATETAAGIVRLFEWDRDPQAIDPVLGGRAIAVRGQDFVASVVDRLLEPDRRSVTRDRWSMLRWLIRSGAAPKPSDARYTLALASAFTTAVNWRDPDGIYTALIEDPDLLEDEVWRLFEVDVVVELDQQRVWRNADGPPGVISIGKENRWHRALIRLANERFIERARLLDASLAALRMDFRASRIGWHGELHEGLEPTTEERAERIECYAALCSSSNPAVVRVGLTGLEAAIERVPADLLARQAAGPLALKEKKYAMAMLRLLEDALKRTPDAADVLLAAVAQGLAHVRPDVQERALELLERNAPRLETRARAAVLGSAESVAPTLRARVDQLLGMSTAADPAPTTELATDEDMAVPLAQRLGSLEPDSAWRTAAQRAVDQATRGEWPSAREAVLGPEAIRRLYAPVEPVDGLDELVEVAASVLEGDSSGEQVERLLDGACRLCDQRDTSARRATAALLKRADELLRTDQASGISARTICAFVLRAWFERDSTLVGLYSSERLSHIGATMLRGKPRALEALPTHVGGWVDPAILEERTHRRSDPVELACAAARAPKRPPHDELVPRIEYFMDWRNVRRLGDTRVADRLLPPRARGLSLAGILAQLPASWESFSREANRCITDHDLRKAGVTDVAGARRTAGDPVLVFVSPGAADDPASRFLSRMYSDPGMRGWKREVAWAGDRGGARWLMSLYPSRQDVFFALAATNAYVFAEDNNVYGFGDVVLERAFDGLVEIGQAGWFAIACSLLVRAATPRRLAGDLVAATIDDGRFDPRGLGGALGWLLGEGTGTPGRATAALADVARVSRLHGAQILRLLWGLVPLLGPSRRGIHEPLELALQLATELGVIGDDNGVRAALGDLRANASPRSKVGTAARGLLDLPETANGAGIHEYAAAEAVVRWAESVDQAG